MTVGCSNRKQAKLILMLVTENIHYTFVLLTSSLYYSIFCKSISIALGMYLHGKALHYCIA